jgi:uncharacterized membrane protein YidH (DUF202 family)
MEVSILVAKLYAVVGLLLGLGILVNPKYYRKTFLEILNAKTALFFAGVFAAIGGVLLVTYHNVWEKSWVVIITIIGWAALVKGIALIVFPESFSFLRKYYKSTAYWRFQAVALIIFALVLGYFGFLI